MTKQLQVKRKPRRVRWTWPEVLPLDPHDPEVLRAKALLRAEGPQTAESLGG